MPERFTSSIDPARDGVIIVKSDTQTLDPKIKALWANAAGTLIWDGETGIDIHMVIPGPGPVPVVPKRVKTASSFTAGQLVGMMG